MSDLPASYPTQHLGRAFTNWLIPYVKSRLFPNQFRPLIAYLMTEEDCNLDCHYCWVKRRGGTCMSETTAMDALDWLRANGCRVVALMGGEPLLRRELVTRVVRYGSARGFFMYLPTNGVLLDEDYIDELGHAGVASINLGVDVLTPKPGLPKAFSSIERQFSYLLKQQRRYGYMVLFTINVCRNNLYDVQELVEIANRRAVPVDIHVNEPPYLEQSAFAYVDDNPTFIRKEDIRQVDAVLNWLMDKNMQGYRMVNSREHLRRMKDFIRGKSYPWNCRAGRNSCVVKPDGALSPCLPLCGSKHDWGRITHPQFGHRHLAELGKVCNPHCMSTCQYVMSYYYNDANIVRWIVAQGLRQINSERKQA